uniref:Uncharacterized protein n=1 Tax=Aegilops tauschii subsp. strangulata TaxID=200361 RepID=A0A453MUL0_AEGTS
MVHILSSVRRYHIYFLFPCHQSMFRSSKSLLLIHTTCYISSAYQFLYPKHGRCQEVPNDLSHPRPDSRS